MHVRSICLPLILLGLLVLAACDGTAATDTTDTATDAHNSTDTAVTPVNAATGASEWVSFRLQLPLPDDFTALTAGLIGAQAQAGKFVAERKLADGYVISSSADPATPGQGRVTVAFDDESGKHRRKLAEIPVSFGLGGTYVATVQAAMAKMKADMVKGGPDDGQPFFLEYRVVSSQGGSFTWAVRGDHGQFSLILEVASPRTSLAQAQIGQALQSAAAFDSIAGTVWFTMNKDDFDFFVDHAYGAGATSKQNFKDFQLVPHNWLRLSVEPHLDQQFVDVGFEVVTLDGKRLAIAKAPASILAGAAFQALVDRNMANSLKQEEAKKGASLPWETTFYYDHPQGGGVVRVVASGDKGVFRVAYAVESPLHALKDVPFLAYEPVVFPAKDPKADAACDQLGDPAIQPAAQGTLDITFHASKIILESKELKVPLKANIQCSVFKASDVTVMGPNDGVVELQSFQLTNADLQAAVKPVFTTKLLLAGAYQVLCFQDLDANGDASKGDPVTLPIGGQEVACNKNPVIVEFSLLNPQ